MLPPMTMNRHRLAAMLLALTLVAAACGGGADEPTTTADQGRLVIYSGRSEELVGPIIDRFSADTGITVEVRYAGTGDLATTLLQEGAASPADVFYAQDPAWIGAVALANLLQPLPADITDLVSERFSDTEGRWVGITVRTRVFVYNPDLVAEEELPTDIWELTDPAWRGRVGIAPTNGSFVAFVAAMLLAEGEERTLTWLRGIAANDPVIFEGNSPIVAAADAGDVPAGLVNHYYLLRIIVEQGEATAINHFFLSGDPGAVVLPTGAGVLATSQNPEGAFELIRYLLDTESQTYFLEDVLEYPVIDGIGTPTGQVPLEDLPTPDISLSDLGAVLEDATDLIAEAGLT